MKNRNNNQPPHRALAFFRWFCNPQFHEELEGDLVERFEKRSEYTGQTRNKMLFIKDIMTLFRPRFIGSPRQLISGFFTTIKPFLNSAPEYYLILLVFLCGYTTPYYIGTKTAVIIALLALQIYFKNKVAWTMIATLLLLINLYMILAMLSEFSEFPLFTLKAFEMLLVGSTIIVFNIAMCGVLIVKHAHADTKIVFNSLYVATSGIFMLGMVGMSNRFPAHTTSGFMLGTGVALLLINLFVATVMVYRYGKKENKAKNIQNIA